MNNRSDVGDTLDASVDDQVLCNLMEELTQKAQTGQSLNLERYTQRYPQYAKQLKQMSVTLAALAELARSGTSKSSSSGFSADASNLTAGILGDYRILREAGRGGMGVVYEAEQISLGRHVALKILPLAAVFDQRQLRRFRNEAQAAANLHHQNIVPVFGVGCERGVHYYAMQFIEGQSLDAIIRQLRQEDGIDVGANDAELTVTHAQSASASPNETYRTRMESETAKRVEADTIRMAAADLSTIRIRSPGAYYRAVAQMMVQVAQALEHAHREGILHRDIKPSNLILDPDGKVWVTDFGLARIESQPGVTHSGDIVGTLGYMSPEQVMAKHGVIDHRTDVYALGATFYELLTLRSTFDASNREAMIRQLTSDDPRAPRQLVRAIPRELDTIVMKALSKAPEERYSTAGELADDLLQFLDDRPIRAKPPSVAHRILKWARRHRAAVATAIVGLVMVLVASTLVLFSQKQKTESARQRAVANLGIAQSAFEQEREQRANAERERQRAAKNFGLAQQAIDSLLTEVAESDLLHVPRMEPLRQSLLNRALTFYRDLLQQQSDNKELRRETALAYQRVGDIQAQLGNHAEAEQAYRQAVAHFQVLCDTGHRCYFDLAKAQNQLALHFKLLGQLDKASTALTEALANVRHAANWAESTSEDIQFIEATIQLNTAGLKLQMGRVDECEMSFRSALNAYEELTERFPYERQYQDRLATSCQNLALFYTASGHYRDSDKMLSKSLELRRRLVAEAPRETQYQVALALLHNSRAALFNVESRYDEAQQAWEKAVEIWRALAESHPEVPQHRNDLASVYHNLGILHKNKGDYGEAARLLLQAQTLREKLVATWPDVPDYRRNLALGLNSLGNVHREAETPEDAESCYQTALDIQRQLAREHPGTAEFSVDLAGTLISYATLRLTSGQRERAHALFERAQGKLVSFLQQQPNNVRALEFLRQAKLGMEMSKEQPPE